MQKTKINRYSLSLPFFYPLTDLTLFDKFQKNAIFLHGLYTFDQKRLKNDGDLRQKQKGRLSYP